MCELFGRMVRGFPGIGGGRGEVESRGNGDKKDRQY